MDKFSLDYGYLDKKINQKKTYRFNDVKDRLEKVAFDVVRFKDSDNIDGLWQIQATDDGEVIVAMYEDMPSKSAEKKSNWQALSDKVGSVVNIFYNGYPILKVSTASLGVKTLADVELLSEAIVDGLSESVALRSSLLGQLSTEERKELLNKYPEIAG